MKATNKEEQAFHECYQLLYENSEPKADFKKLVEDAEFNEQGQKVIDFNAYEIEEEKFYDILEDVIKRYKIKSFRAQAFRNAIILGCSPKFKKSVNNTIENGEQ
jgi:hypothetical protein